MGTKHNPIIARSMTIEVQSDDDFTIDGIGRFDSGYSVMFPLKEKETLVRGYGRWLKSITVEGYKAEEAKTWLEDLDHIDDDELQIFGGNWSLSAYLNTTKKYAVQARLTLHIYWKDLPKKLQDSYFGGLNGMQYLEVSSKKLYEKRREEAPLSYDERFVKNYLDIFGFKNVCFEDVVIHMT